MRKWMCGPARRVQALLLCGVFLCGILTGCQAPAGGGESGAAGKLAGQPATVNLRADGAQPAAVMRADIDYADITYTRFERSRMDALEEALENLARSGGTQDQFDAADTEISAALEEAATMYAVIQIQYSQDPSNQEIADEQLYASESVYEANEDYWNAMHAVAASDARGLMEERYSRSEIRAFRQYDDAGSDEISELTSQEDRLVQQYYTLTAGDAPDTDAIAALYVQLVGVRRQIAAAHGYSSYADYAYENLYARNYTPQDAEKLWEAARRCFVPVSDAHSDATYSRLSKLYYSAAIDTGEDAIFQSMAEVLPQISDRLVEPFEYLQAYHLYDVGASSTKMNAGYTTYLYAYGEPFIFNNPTGSFFDYTTLYHEFGHFVSMYRHGSDLRFGVSDNDLCELQSQGMEALFLPYYEQIFGSQYGPAIRDGVTINLLYSVIEGAMYDEFQQKVYAEPQLTAARVQEIFDQTAAEYGRDQTEGYETEWMSIPHNFDEPFYYISYAASAIPALELYGMPQDAAVTAYLQISDSDPEQYYFSEALQNAELSDVFDTAADARIAAAVDAKFTY